MFYKKKYLNLKKEYRALSREYKLDMYEIEMLRRTNEHLGYRIADLEEDYAQCVKQTLCRVEELAFEELIKEHIDTDGEKTDVCFIKIISRVISKIMEENKTNTEERGEDVQTSLFDL